MQPAFQGTQCHESSITWRVAPSKYYILCKKSISCTRTQIHRSKVELIGREQAHRCNIPAQAHVQSQSAISFSTSPKRKVILVTVLSSTRRTYTTQIWFTNIVPHKVWTKRPSYASPGVIHLIKHGDRQHHTSWSTRVLQLRTVEIHGSNPLCWKLASATPSNQGVSVGSTRSRKSETEEVRVSGFYSRAARWHAVHGFKVVVRGNDSLHAWINVGGEAR